MWLVHGEYGLGQRHAWVELPGDVVFDGVLQRFYKKLAYYDIELAVRSSSRSFSGMCAVRRLG
jgi:hypothetical protein